MNRAQLQPEPRLWKVVQGLVAFAILAPLFPVAANAQLLLFTYNGTTQIETPVGATYQFGSVSAGSNAGVRFRVFNNGTSPVTISTLSVAGAGFSFSAINGSAPYVIPPTPSSLNFLEFTVQFSGTLVASYSANLQVNGISVLLLAAVQPAPVITFSPPCTPDPNSGTDFPKVQMGASIGCNFYVQNPSSQPISVTVTGNGFVQQGIQSPLNPGGATSFMITFTPVCGTAIYNGSLVVNGQTFALSATGITPTLAPIINVDSVSVSAQQPTVTLSLPTAAPCGATGYLNLAFTSSVQGVASDSAVKFLQGNVTSLPFSVAQSSTVATFNGQPSTTFQTGTTAGAITFTTTETPMAGDPTATATTTIPPAIITIDTATASNQISGQLNVTVTGFDNTYSAGMMSFTFFDTSGKQVGSVVSSNFTSCFAGYFGLGTTTTGCSPAGQNSGGTFLMLISFPVLGNQALIGTVQATLTNKAGPVQTGPLTFQ